MSARSLLAKLSTLLLVVTCVGCSNDVQDQRSTCADDTECDPGFVCALGYCMDPSDQILARVALEVEPPADSTYPTQQFLDVDPRNERVRIGLHRSVRVTSFVRLSDGQPVAAQVAALPTPEEQIVGRVPVLSTASDATTGAFALELVDQRRYRLAIVPDDPSLPPLLEETAFVVDAGGLDVIERTPYVLAQADVSTLVTGRVVASDGGTAQPIEKLAVLLKDGERRVSSLARTDPTGGFTLAVGPNVTGPLTLEVRSTTENAYFPTVRRTGVIVEGDADLGEVDLGIVTSPTHLVGVVVGPSGDPARKATLYTTGTVGNGTFSAQATTDDNGNFDVTVPPGSYQLAVVPAVPGRAGARDGLAVNVTAAANEPLRITLPARTRVVGAVRTHEKQPAPNIALSFSRLPASTEGTDPLGGLTWSFSGTSRDDGTYTLELDPGEYRITATPPRGTNLARHTAIVRFGADGGQQDIELDPPAVVAGVAVDDATGAGVSGVYVRAFSDILDELGQAIPLGEGLVNSDGSFELLLPDLAAP